MIINKIRLLLLKKERKKKHNNAFAFATITKQNLKTTVTEKIKKIK